MTAIQWTDETWNPTTGCAKVSTGCKNCYAERLAPRVFAGQVVTKDGRERPRRFTDVWFHRERLTKPLRWRKPRRVFVNSMSDLFHPAVRDDQIDEIFGVMAQAGRHTFQVLTKRPERMRDYLAADGVRERINAAANALTEPPDNDCALNAGWPLPNVWLGTSVEDQAAARQRLSALAETPAAIRFASVEPLLGHVDLSPWLDEIGTAVNCVDCGLRKEPWGRSAPLEMANGLCDHECPGYDKDPRPGGLWPGESLREFGFPKEVVRRICLDWVIVGGESGPGARPCLYEWVRDVVRQCDDARTPVFVKQLGGSPWRGDERARRSMNLSDPKGGNPGEWPEDVRRREWPEVDRD